MFFVDPRPRRTPHYNANALMPPRISSNAPALDPKTIAFYFEKVCSLGPGDELQNWGPGGGDSGTTRTQKESQGGFMERPSVRKHQLLGGPPGAFFRGPGPEKQETIRNNRKQ